jgi:carbonic anhydrase
MILLKDGNPIAASQWCHDLNVGMDLEKIALRSGKLVYFKCSNNDKHIWQTKVYQRTKNGLNIDCPFCSGREAFTGETDLLTAHPIIKDLWDYDNNTLNPIKILPNSTKKAYFKCEKGHTFTKRISKFVEKPVCVQCEFESNNLAALRPDILSWWDYEQNEKGPETYYKNSSSIVFWKCPKCSYCWEAEIASRVASKLQCPCCDIGIALKKGINDFQSKNHELALDWNYEKNTNITPDLIFVNHPEPVWWKCQKCQYEWKTLIVSRHMNGKRRECPRCAGKIAHINVTDLSTTHSDYAKEYVPELNTIPLENLKAGTNATITWKCSKCHQIFKSSPLSRTRSPKGGCPFCDGKVPIVGENDFKKLHFELLAEWDYEINQNSPDTYTEYSNHVVAWICKNNPEHKWMASIQQRSYGRKCCPFCEEIKNGNSLKDKRPDLLEFWDYSVNVKGPECYTQYSNKEVGWCCQNGHKFIQKIMLASIKLQFSCGYCNDIILVPGENDLKSQFPELVWEYDLAENLLQPYEVRINSTVPVYWKCEEYGHSYKASPRDRVYENKTCPICANIQVSKGFNDLYTHHTTVKAVWNYKKNGERNPTNVLYDINTRFYFICEKGHEWKEALQSAIANKFSCPYCENRLPLAKFNTLAARFSKLLKEWCDENEDDPDEILPSTRKSVKWNCSACSNQYFASVYDRTVGKGNCPYCEERKVDPKRTSFKAKFPTLALEFSYSNKVQADRIFPTYTEYVKWDCSKCKMNWQSTVRDRVSGEATCPYCDGRKAIPGKTSLAALFFDISRELDSENNIDADTLLPGSSQYVKWDCSKCKMEWWSSVKNRTSGEATCPYCDGRKVIPGETSLAALFFDISRELDSENNIDADTLLPGSSQYVKWNCSKCKMEWWSSVKNRTSGEATCPYCDGRKAIPGKTSLAALFFDISCELDSENNIDADTLLPSSSQYVKWNCSECKMNWQSAVRDRVSGVSTCPYCDGRKIIPGKNSLAALFFDISCELDSENNIDADTLLPSSSQYVKWNCSECKMNWQSAVRDRVSGEATCPYCDGRKAIPGKTSLATLFFDISCELDSENNIDADTLLPGSSQHVKWNCSECKMNWQSAVRDRVSGEATCPYCDGRKAIPGKTSLAALFFDISRELDSENNIDADTLLPSSSQYVKWNCSECKMNWQSAVRDRVSGEATCPYCDGRKAIPGKTSLAVSQSELMKEWKYISNFYLLDPDTINEKCNNEVWWKCPECNNSYKMSPKARLYNQKRKFESCPYCKGRRRKRHFF